MNETDITTAPSPRRGIWPDREAPRCRVCLLFFHRCLCLWSGVVPEDSRPRTREELYAAHGMEAPPSGAAPSQPVAEAKRGPPDTRETPRLDAGGSETSNGTGDVENHTNAPGRPLSETGGEISLYRRAMSRYVRLSPERLEGLNVVPHRDLRGRPGLGFPPEGVRGALHVRGIGSDGEVMMEAEGERPKWIWVGGKGRGKSAYLPFPIDSFDRERPVFLVEGEGDAVAVAAALRCPALASTGSGGFPFEAGELIVSLVAKGRNVVAWPDPDPSGAAWMENVREATGGAASLLYIPTAPGFPDPPAPPPFRADARDAWLSFRGDGGDIGEAGAALGFLTAAMEAVRPFPPSAPPTPEETAKRVRKAMRESARGVSWRKPHPQGRGPSYSPDEAREEVASRWGADYLITQKLSGTRRGKGSYSCPFHEDRTASFSVFGKGGNTGWKCHAAGCGAKGDLIDLWGRAFVPNASGRKEVFQKLCDELRGNP